MRKNKALLSAPYGQEKSEHRGRHWIIGNTCGFTLLEVTIAVAIMAMVLVTLIGLKNSSMQEVALAKHITIATMLAKRVMVDVMGSKPRLPSEDEGEFPEAEFKDYNWKKTVVTTPFVQIMEVHVAVVWNEGTRQESVELVSYE